MCRHINLMWCATIISSCIVEATSLEVKEPAQDDEVKFSTAIEPYSEQT